ncbi:MAG TPA: Flp pilus assembly protein CpaB [Bdellovibrionales bacterium]|nr:Flp pilus assembly protein CpaB [Bdellovibrionales bacterium]
MNPNPTRTLWVSIAAAVFGMILIYSYSQEKKAEYDKRYGTSKRVLVAAKDILEMSTIDDTMVQIEERPVDFIQPGAVETPEEAVGFVAATPIKKGEQMLNTKLLKPGPSTGLSLQVSPNKRAVTLPIDEVRGISKLIRPGDRIDVLTSLEYGRGADQKREVKTILQDVIVLATGTHITNNIPRQLETDSTGKSSFRNLIGDTTFTTVTLEVTPNEAQSLIYIMSSSPGSIYLTLRNPNDRARLNMGTTSVLGVLGKNDLPEVRVPAAVPPPVATPQNPARPQPRRRAGPFVEVN